MDELGQQGAPFVGWSVACFLKDEEKANALIKFVFSI
jgi:hypothetical protein